MGIREKTCVAFTASLFALAGCRAPGTYSDCELPPVPVDVAVLVHDSSPVAPDDAIVAVSVELPAVPATQPEDRPLPINLPSAMQLANARAVDIQAAAERICIAAAALEGAEVLWIPSLTVGGDYNRHDGTNQDVLGNVIDNSRSSAMFGVGTGMLNAGVISLNDAIFAPLAARQLLRAKQADRQAASNDTLVAVSEAYFTVQQARGELAGAVEATRRTEDLLAQTRKLAAAIVPDLEVFRAETELARRQEAELFARERWKVASAELMRVVRMDPTAQVEPLEPPHLRVELIDLRRPVEELVPVGLTHRPELASQQAMVQATLALLKQERFRPLLPSVLLRGFSTPVTGTLGAGIFGAGTGGSIDHSGLRSDFDLQLLWQLNNLGFGNRALIRQRESENRLALVELFKIQDRVAADIAKAHAQAQQASRRVEVTERELRAAVLSADKNLAALSQTKGVGAQMVTLVRPQEVVASIQALGQAYIEYYGAIADANRAQFRLYRALGQPAEYLAEQGQLGNPPEAALAPTAVPQPTDEPVPAAPPVPAKTGDDPERRVPE